LARAAKQAGYEVTLVTRVGEYADRIRAEGFKLIPVQIERRSSNPIRELRVIAALVSIYRRECPDIVHHVALKPVLYGSLVARLTRVPAMVNALAGLGYVFSSNEWKARIFRPIVQMAYRLLLNRKKTRVIVQNPDDLQLLTAGGVLDGKHIVMIRGSGVDIHYLRTLPEPEGAPLIVFAARMLRDKGVCEYVAAAKLLRRQGLQARFVLVGDRDSESPTAISAEQLADWQRNTVVEWWGHRDDIREVFAQAHIVCLPSYREGLPKVLLEAASCGRPIVATDVPGCREVVRDGENGLLVPPRNVTALAQALRQLVEKPELRRQMGARGREIVMTEFSVEKVVHETLEVYRELFA